MGRVEVDCRRAVKKVSLWLDGADNITFAATPPDWSGVRLEEPSGKRHRLIPEQDIRDFANALLEMCEQ